MSCHVTVELHLRECSLAMSLEAVFEDGWLTLVVTTGPEVIKLFPCSTQLSMIFFLLINVKMPTTVGILTLFSGKNSILDLSEP